MVELDGKKYLVFAGDKVCVVTKINDQGQPISWRKLGRGPTRLRVLKTWVIDTDNKLSNENN